MLNGIITLEDYCVSKIKNNLDFLASSSSASASYMD